MMREWDMFETWARESWPLAVPTVNVTDRVVRTIQCRPRPADLERPALAIAATALIAASVALATAWQTWQIAHDPLAQVFKPPSYLTVR